MQDVFAWMNLMTGVAFALFLLYGFGVSIKENEYRASSACTITGMDAWRVKA